VSPPVWLVGVWGNFPPSSSGYRPTESGQLPRKFPGSYRWWPMRSLFADGCLISTIRKPFRRFARDPAFPPTVGLGGVPPRPRGPGKEKCSGGPPFRPGSHWSTRRRRRWWNCPLKHRTGGIGNVLIDEGVPFSFHSGKSLGPGAGTRIQARARRSGIPPSPIGKSAPRLGR